MDFFPLLHSMTTAFYLFLAGYILLKNPKVLLNRIGSAYVFTFAVWSFSLIFIHNLQTSKETARLFLNIGVMGGIFTCCFFLWFMLVFTGKTALLKKKWLYLVILGIPLLFVYAQWTNSLYVDFNRWHGGWVVLLNRDSTWPYLFLLYVFGFTVLGIYILFQLMRTTWDKIIKKQAKLILITIMISLILAGSLEVIMPLLDIKVIPDFGDFVVIFMLSGLTLAIAKYKLLAITPAIAAENIISTIFDFLIILNPVGRIARVNNATLEALGYKEHELVGKPVGILFPGEDSTGDITREILDQKNLKNKDFVFKTRGGEKVDVLFSSSLLIDKSGILLGIVCAARDISARKKLEEEIFKIKKLESIGILAGGIAHDFNNLLSVVIGNISLALDEKSSRAKMLKFLAESEKAALKASELAMKFITFSRGDWLKKEVLLVSRLLEDVKNMDIGSPGEKIVYNFHIPANLTPVSGDEFQLKETLKNIFLNSIEAMPQGGTISVQAENIVLEAGNEFLLPEGQYVKILIADNGIGISPMDLDKIFDPYFSTKGNVTQKGLGLGLTVCYSVIKKHDGHICIESEPGKGTTVILYLPAFIQPPSA